MYPVYIHGHIKLYISPSVLTLPEGNQTGVLFDSRVRVLWCGKSPSGIYVTTAEVENLKASRGPSEGTEAEKKRLSPPASDDHMSMHTSGWHHKKYV